MGAFFILLPGSAGEENEWRIHMRVAWIDRGWGETIR